MKKIIYLFAFSLLAIYSCSLMKVTVDTGVEPLEKKELNKRVAVRLFSTNFTESVIKAADSIYVLNADPVVKFNSIIWKANATQACMKTSLHSIPESALLNTWVFVSGMNEFSKTDESFKQNQNILQITSETMLDRYEFLASKYLTDGEYRRMNAFVDSIVVEHPYTMDFITKDYTSAWQQYANIPDSVYVSTYGSISETLGDLSDKASFISENVANQVEWVGDKAQLRVSQGLLDSAHVARIVAVEETLAALNQFMADAPAATDSLAKFTEVQLIMMMESLQGMINTTLMGISSERALVEKYITAEREAIISQAQYAAQEVVNGALERLPILIRDFFTYFILGLILLLGLPMALGYYIGKLKHRTKKSS